MIRAALDVSVHTFTVRVSLRSNGTHSNIATAAINDVTTKIMKKP